MIQNAKVHQYLVHPAPFHQNQWESFQTEGNNTVQTF